MLSSLFMLLLLLLCMLSNQTLVNGKYVGSFYYGQDESGTTVFYPVIIDVEKDEWHELGPFPKTLFELGETSCMTDNGEVIIAALNDANILSTSTGTIRR